MNEKKFKEIFDSVEIVQDPKELLWLVNLVEKTNPKIIIEIGVQNGGSLKFWEQLLPEGGLLIGIDTNDPQRVVGWDWGKSNREIHLIEGNSRDVSVALRVHRILGQREADFIFIDGEHGYEAVKGDFRLYSGFVRNGGLIGFHDIYEALDFFRFLSGMKFIAHNKMGTGVWWKGG